MSMVRFATLCDICGVRGEEYRVDPSEDDHWPRSWPAGAAPHPLATLTVGPMDVARIAMAQEQEDEMERSRR